jgi:hypothetical protein
MGNIEHAVVSYVTPLDRNAKAGNQVDFKGEKIYRYRAKVAELESDKAVGYF